MEANPFCFPFLRLRAQILTGFAFSLTSIGRSELTKVEGGGSPNPETSLALVLPYEALQYANIACFRTLRSGINGCYENVHIIGEGQPTRILAWIFPVAPFPSPLPSPLKKQ